jgi:hypothetical protein
MLVILTPLSQFEGQKYHLLKCCFSMITTHSYNLSLCSKRLALPNIEQNSLVCLDRPAYPFILLPETFQHLRPYYLGRIVLILINGAVKIVWTPLGEK